MQKILVLFGSPNKQGHTAALLNLFLEQYIRRLHDEVEVKRIALYQQCVLPCIGCQKCKAGECVQSEDDAGAIFRQIQASDHVILAAPLYFSNFPAPVKSLIDRAQPFYEAFAKRGFINRRMRKGALVATCGCDDKNAFSGMIATTRAFFDCMDIAWVDTLFAGNTDNPTHIKIFDHEERGYGSWK